MAGLATRCLEFMGNFRPLEYSNIMWGLSKLNYVPSAEWMAAVGAGAEWALACRARVGGDGG